MFIHSLLLNKKYCLSKRNFLNDYYYQKKGSINMITTGSYLVNHKNKLINKYSLDKYPAEEEFLKLKDQIKKKNKISEKNDVIIGPGSNGIIQNIIKICFQKKGNLVTPFYTFDQAEYACTSYDSITRRTYMNDDGHINFHNIRAAIDKKTRLVYICNPNNITGIYEDYQEILKLVSSYKNVLFLIDESSIEFTNKKSILNYKIADNVLVIRTFSKAYGLANIRVGYLICSKDFSKEYYSKITINQVSGLSLYIANIRYAKQDYLDNVDKVNKERNTIVNELAKYGIDTYESETNVILTKNVPNNFEKFLNANDITLLKVNDQNNIMHYRIAVQEKIINERFIKILGGINEIK